MKKSKTIHNSELRRHGYRWYFELTTEDVTRALGLCITQMDPSGNKQKLTMYRHQLPAFISHLRRGLQEIGELGKK